MARGKPGTVTPKPKTSENPKGVQVLTPAEREDAIRLIQDLYLQGKTQTEIAAKLRIAQQTVSYYLKTIKQRWEENTAINLDAYKILQLDRIDTLEREAYAAWLRSIPPTPVPGQPDEGRQYQPKRRGQAPDQLDVVGWGDTRYLAIVQWCIQERSKLLGLYAPARTEISGAAAGPIKVESTQRSDLSRLNVAELESLRAIALKAAGNDTAVPA